jgi:hypothetical protein
MQIQVLVLVLELVLVPSLVAARKHYFTLLWKKAYHYAGVVFVNSEVVCRIGSRPNEREVGADDERQWGFRKGAFGKRKGFHCESTFHGPEKQ